MILRLKLATPHQIGRCRGLKPIRAGQEIVEKGQPCVDREPLRAPVVKLGQYQRWDDAILELFGHQRGARGMVWIGCIECGQKRPSVEYQRHVIEAVWKPVPA